MLEKPHLGRRRLLRGLAASAVAAPYVITSHALGGPDKMPASERIGLGFVGMGQRGRQIMGGFLGPGTECRAVCDVWENRREAARRRGGNGCSAYRDYRDLLARRDVDAVVIATPEYWHAVIAVAAARAGKDIYCEKALSISVAEGRAICDAVTRQGRVFQHGTQQRSDGRFRLACELVHNGRIGRLRTIRASVPRSSATTHRNPVPVPKDLDYDLWLGPSPWIPHCGQAGIGHPGWCFRSDYSPGFILTWGVHHLDIAQWGHGSQRSGPVAFEGRGVFPPDGFDDAVLTWRVECTYRDGVKLVFTSSDKEPVGVRFEGDEGWIFVSRATLRSGPDSLLQSPLAPGAERLYQSSSHAGNFIDCVRSRRPAVAGVEEAHRSTTIGLVSAIAVQLGRKLRWDPAREEFPDDPEANRMLARALREPWRI